MDRIWEFIQIPVVVGFTSGVTYHTLGLGSLEAHQNETSKTCVEWWRMNSQEDIWDLVRIKREVP